MTAFWEPIRIAGRHTRALLRQPWYIGVSLTQPLIWLLLFGQLFKQVATLPGFPTGSYVAYLAPGVMLMTSMFANSWNGMTMLDDMESGVLDRMLVSPIRRSALLNGITLEMTVSLTLQVSVLIGLAVMVGANFPGGPIGMVVLLIVSVLLGAAFGGMSMATALTVRQRESVIGMNQFLVLPGIFLSTAFMPGDLLPGWIATAARYNPVDWAATAAREGLLSSSPDWSVVAPRIALLAGFAAIMTLAGTRSFRSYQRSL